MKEVILTPEGHKKLQEEIEYLSTTRQASVASSIRCAPAPVFVTFRTGQPKFMSTMSAPAASTIRAASAIGPGSEPKIWIASGCSSGATRR